MSSLLLFVLISKVNRDDEFRSTTLQTRSANVKRTQNEPQANEIPTLPNASHLSVKPRPRFAYEQQTAGRLGNRFEQLTETLTRHTAQLFIRLSDARVISFTRFAIRVRCAAALSPKVSVRRFDKINRQKELEGKTSAGWRAGCEETNRRRKVWPRTVRPRSSCSPLGY